jgi:hypothetical protein
MPVNPGDRAEVKTQNSLSYNKYSLRRKITKRNYRDSPALRVLFDRSRRRRQSVRLAYCKFR